jgi:hypothetical protein
MQRLDACGEKLEANVMVSVFLSLELPASGFKRMTALADGLRRSFETLSQARMTAHGINGSHQICTGDDI